jgi:hypothetical protein
VFHGSDAPPPDEIVETGTYRTPIMRRHDERDLLAGPLVHGRRLDRNPLRRGCDRTETVVLGVLLAAFLAAAPFAAHAAGSWAYALSAREAQAQRTALRQVPTTLTQASSQPAFYLGTGPFPSASARAGGLLTGRYEPGSCSSRPARPRAPPCRCGWTGPAGWPGLRSAAPS